MKLQNETQLGTTSSTTSTTSTPSSTGDEASSKHSTKPSISTTKSKDTIKKTVKSKWDIDDDDLVPAITITSASTPPLSSSSHKSDEKLKSLHQALDDNKRELLRQLEIQVQTLADKLESEGINKEQIDSRCQQLRQDLTKKLEAGNFNSSENTTTHNNNNK